MKNITILFSLILSSSICAEEKTVLTAESGDFKITQEYKDDFIESISFRDPKISPTLLSGYSWPGSYRLSPNEQWLSRIQKIGSGESMILLYEIEKNGRITEVLGFDDLLWNFSDSISKLKKKELFHTNISQVTWANEGDSLALVLNGVNQENNKEVLKTSLIYHIKKNKIELNKE